VPDINLTPAVSIARVFLTFLRLGATAFGGPAMLAYIRMIVVEQEQWLDEGTVHDGVALCQTIPGATAMQLSAYVGYRVRGVAGAAASFIGFGLPSFLLMMMLSAFYGRWSKLPTGLSAFHGLQVIIVALVANATVAFARASLKHWRHVIIALVAAGMFGWGIHPISVLLLSAVFGFALPHRPSVPDLTIDAARDFRSTRPLVWLLALAALAYVGLFFVERRLFELAIFMFRIDLFAFGGGFASVPLMFHEIVEARSWMDASTFLDGIALGQITPGPIVITATFVGYLLYGVVGGIIATISVFLPSFVIAVGIAPYFDRLRRSFSFQQAIGGIVCTSVGLMFTVTIRFALDIPWDLMRVLLASTAFAALLVKTDIIWVVLIGTAVSVLAL
jgi:chromate transporter